MCENICLGGITMGVHGKLVNFTGMLQPLAVLGFGIEHQGHNCWSRQGDALFRFLEWALLAQAQATTCPALEKFGFFCPFLLRLSTTVLSLCFHRQNASSSTAHRYGRNRWATNDWYMCCSVSVHLCCAARFRTAECVLQLK